MEKQPLLNTYINNVTMSETVEAIEQMIAAIRSLTLWQSMLTLL